jgi:hypothetical protein
VPGFDPAVGQEPLQTRDVRLENTGSDAPVGTRHEAAGVEDGEGVIGIRGDRGATAPRRANDESPERPVLALNA